MNSSSHEQVQAIDTHGHKVQRMFSSIAHGYDRANRLMSLGLDIRWRTRAVAQFLAQLRHLQSPRVLDLCAGTLDSSLEIHVQCPQATITAGDFSAGMLDQGSRKLHGEAKQKILPQQMDAHQIPSEDGCYDGVFCAFGIRNLSDIERASSEQARVLNKRGVLTVLDFFQPESWFPRMALSIHHRTVLPLIGWAATGNLSAYLYLPRSIGQFITVHDYQTLLARHGFTILGAQPLTGGLAWIVQAKRSELS